MRRVELFVQSIEGEIFQTQFDFDELILGGWTGRNAEEVRSHIEELKRIGVPGPERVPSFFRVSSNLLDTSRVIQVISDETNGEVEYVLFISSGELKYVTVGSDHTDRGVERINVHLSKQLYPKLISPLVWEFDDVKTHWDEIILRMRVDGILSQEAKLSALLPPEELLKLVDLRSENAVLFSGSISWIGNSLRFGKRYSFSIVDPVLGRGISHSYEVLRI